MRLEESDEDTLMRMDRLLVDVLLPTNCGTEGTRRGPVELDPELLYGDFSYNQGDIGRDEPVDDVSVQQKVSRVQSRNHTESRGDGCPEGRIGTRVYHDGIVDAKHSSRLKERLEELRTERDGKEMKECTFRPKVGRGPREGLCCNGAERYMIRSGKREKDVQRWKEEEEARLKEECTFVPLLREDSVKKELGARGVFKVPIQNRLATERRRKEERLQKAKEKVDVDVTFQPKIDLMSRRIAERRKERGVRVCRKDCHVPEESSGEPRFRCAKSDKILENSETIPLDFEERQEYFSNKYREKQEEGKRREESTKSTGRPAKIPAELLIGSERLVRQMLESEEERIERMCFGEHRRIEEQRRQRKKALESQFRFKPELNKRSLEMSKDAQNVVPRFQKDLETYKSEKYRDCTFQPDVSKPRVYGYHDVYQVPQGQAPLAVSRALQHGSMDTFMETIAEYEAKKKEKAALIKKEQEAKEIEGCTFAPKINKPGSAHSDLEILETLPGMEKYFEKMLRIERKVEEKKEREKQVFADGSSWVNQVTVPEPFSLASSRRIHV